MYCSVARGEFVFNECCILSAPDLGPCSVTHWRSMITRPKHSMTATVLTLAAMLALSNAAQLGSSVVCVGSDGHIDVETSICTCCSVPASHSESFHSELAPAIPSCSDCVDVPMSVPSNKSGTPLLSTPHIKAEGRMIALSSAGGCKTGLLFEANQMDQHWHSLSPLSTVVLLT